MLNNNLPFIFSKHSFTLHCNGAPAPAIYVIQVINKHKYEELQGSLTVRGKWRENMAINMLLFFLHQLISTRCAHLIIMRYCVVAWSEFSEKVKQIMNEIMES